jgi:predicted nucleotidyltransferase
VGRGQGQAAEPVIEEVVDALRVYLGDSLRGIALFGSRARGDARPESDWDLLVVADGLPSSLLDRSRMLRQVLRLQALAQQLGFEEHVRSDYGDAGRWITPWELFGEQDARRAIAIARAAMAGSAWIHAQSGAGRYPRAARRAGTRPPRHPYPVFTVTDPGVHVALIFAFTVE